LAKCPDKEATAHMSTAGRDSSQNYKIYGLLDRTKPLAPVKLPSLFQIAL